MAKELKFQAVLDEQSFARVKRALGELNTEAAKLAKTLQGAGGGLFGGGNVGKPPSGTQTQGRGGQNQKVGIGSAILGDVEAFQKLAKSGKSGMDAMTNAVRAGVREQMREIEKLEGKMASLNKVMAKDPRAAYSGSAFTTNLQTHMLSTQAQINAAQGNLAGLQTLQGAPGGPPPPGAGGFLASMGGIGGVGAMAAKIAGMAVAGGVAVLKTSVSADQFGLTQEAMRGQALSPMLSRIRRGDISDQMAMKNLAGRSSAEQMELMRSSLGADSKLLSKISAAAGGLNPFGRAFGDINQAAEGVFGSSQQTTEMIEARQAILDKVKQSPDFLSAQRYLDYAESSRGDRLQSARVAGIGLYRTRDNRPMGLSDMGPNFQSPNRNSVAPDQKRIDALKRHLIQGANLGLDEGARMGSWAESRNQVGDFRYGDAFALANASGFGAFNNVQAAAARMGNGRLANMALGGGINNAAGIQLGQAFIGNGFDARGTVSAAGAFGAFQGGYGGLMGGDPAAHFNLVQQAAAGLGVGDALVGGTTSGWQQGLNVLGAIKANPGGDAYTTDYLATGMTFKQMLAGARGDLTETAKASGLTKEMIKGQLGSVAEGALSMWVDTGANDPRSQAMRKYKASGMGANAYMAGASDADAKAMAAQLGLMNPQFGEEGAIGYMRMTRGMAKGTSAAEGALAVGGLDDEAKDKAKRDIIEIEKTFANMAKHFGEAGDVTKSFKNISDTVESLGQLGLKADELAKKFGALAGMSDAQIQKALESGAVEAVKEGLFTPKKAKWPGK